MNNVTLSTQKNVVVNIVILCIFLFALKNQILRYVVECKAVILLTTLIHTNVTDDILFYFFKCLQITF